MAFRKLWVGVVLVLLIFIFSDAVSAQGDGGDISQLIEKVCGGSKRVRLNNGRNVPCRRIESLVNQIQKGKKLKQLNRLEEAILETAFSSLQKQGYTFKINDEQVNSWQGFYQYIVIAGNKGRKSEKSTNKDISQIIEEVFGGKDQIQLNNGATVSYSSVQTLMKDIKDGKQYEDLTEEQVAILETILAKLQDAGYKFTINKETVTTAKGFYQFILISSGKGSKRPHKKSFIELLISIFKGRDKFKLSNGKTVSLKFILHVIRQLFRSRGKVEKLKPVQKLILELVFNELQKAGYQLSVNGKTVQSEEELYQYILLQRSGRHQKASIWKIIKKILGGEAVTLSDGKKVQLPEVYELLKKIRKGKDFNDLSPEEREILDIIFTRAKSSRVVFKINGKEISSVEELYQWIKITKVRSREHYQREWRMIFNILNKYKGRNKQIKLADGSTVTWEYIIQLLQSVSKGEKPNISSDKDKQALQVVFQILKKNGVKIPTPEGKPKQGNNFQAFLIFLTEAQKPDDKEQEDVGEEPGDKHEDGGKEDDGVEDDDEDSTTTEVTEESTTIASIPESESGTVYQILERIGTFSPEQANTVIISYKNVDVPLKVIIEELNLPVDSNSGTYNTSNVKVEEFYRVLENYVKKSSSLSNELIDDGEETTTVAAPSGSSQLQIITMKILNILKSAGENARGNVIINGKSYSFQTILSMISLKNLSPDTITQEQLQEILLSLVESEPVTEEPTDSTSEDVVILRQVIELLQSGDKNANIVYKGKRIPITFIFQTLKRMNIDPEDLDVKQLAYILNLYMSSGTDDEIKGLTKEYIRVLQRILDYIKTWKKRATGRVLLNGVEIKLKDIISFILSRGTPFDQLTIEELWSVIKYYGDLQKAASAARVTAKQAALEFFLQILGSMKWKNIKNVYFIHDFVKIPVEYFVQELNIQKDSAGNLITDSIDPDAFWAALKKYVSSAPASTESRISSIKSEVKEQLLEIFSDPSTASRKFILVKRRKVPINALLKYLNISYSEAAQYISNLSPEQLWQIIIKFINGASATSSYLAKQKHQLYQIFLRFISNTEQVSSATLKVSGVSVPLLDVVNSLGLKIVDGKYDTSQLSEDELWNVLVMISQGKSKGSSSSSDHSDEFKKRVYQYLVDILSKPEQVSRATLQVNEVSIPVSDIVDKAELEKDSSGNYILDNFSYQQLWQIIQQYLDGSSDSGVKSEDSEVPSTEVTEFPTTDNTEDYTTEITEVSTTETTEVSTTETTEVSTTETTEVSTTETTEVSTTESTECTPNTEGYSTPTVTHLQKYFLYQWLIGLVVNPSSIANKSLTVNDLSYPFEDFLNAMGSKLVKKTYSFKPLNEESVWNQFEKLTEGKYSFNGNSTEFQECLFKYFANVVSTPERAPFAILQVNGIYIPYRDLVNFLALSKNENGSYNIQYSNPQKLWNKVMYFLTAK